MKNFKFFGLFLVMILMAACNMSSEPQSSTGLKQATADVVAQDNGLSVEQQNVKDRLEVENMPGSIKHLYILSSYSGQTILYSTVKGKVTSSGKRLTPNMGVSTGQSNYSQFEVDINGRRINTNEIMGDDGTYGSSIPYLYWWDSKGIYHQHYVSGGQILHVSDQPIKASGVILNIESQ